MFLNKACFFSKQKSQNCVFNVFFQSTFAYSGTAKLLTIKLKVMHRKCCQFWSLILLNPSLVEEEKNCLA